MVSGVGPQHVLQQHGIPIVANRPGVGAGVQDHVFAGVSYRVNVVTASALAYGDAIQQAIEQFDTAQDGFLSSPGGDYVAYEKVPKDLSTSFSKQTIADLDSLPADWPVFEHFTLPAYLDKFKNFAQGQPTVGY